MAVQNEWPWMKGQLDLAVSLGFTFLASILISTKQLKKHEHFKIFPIYNVNTCTLVAVNKVKVNQDSSFVQTWQSRHPQCYIPSLKQRRRFLKCFYLIWAWWPSLSCDH